MDVEPMGKFHKINDVEEGKAKEKAAQQHSRWKEIWKEVREPLQALGLYFVVGYLYYGKLLGWCFVDTIYFAVEILTTVGYGDMAPQDDVSMLFTSAYVVSAMIIVSASVSKILDAILVNKVNTVLEAVEEKKAMSVKQMSEDIAEEHCDTQEKPKEGGESKCTEWYDKFVKPISAYLFWILIGTMFYGYQKQLTDQFKGSAFVHSFYFSVITLCTVGFGDIVPKTQYEKVFDIFFMLIGIPTFANAISALSSLVWEQGDEETMESLKLFHELDSSNMLSLLEFEDELVNYGCGAQDDDKIDRFEYLAYILIRNGILKMSMLQDIMKSFDHIDNDHSGFIELSDLPKSFGDAEGVRARRKWRKVRTIVKSGLLGFKQKLALKPKLKVATLQHGPDMASGPAKSALGDQELPLTNVSVGRKRVFNAERVPDEATAATAPLSPKYHMWEEPKPLVPSSSTKVAMSNTLLDQGKKSEEIPGADGSRFCKTDLEAPQLTDRLLRPDDVNSQHDPDIASGPTQASASLDHGLGGVRALLGQPVLADILGVDEVREASRRQGFKTRKREESGWIEERASSGGVPRESHPLRPFDIDVNRSGFISPDSIPAGRELQPGKFTEGSRPRVEEGATLQGLLQGPSSCRNRDNCGGLLQECRF